MYSPSIRQSSLLRKKGDAGTRTGAAKGGLEKPALRERHGGLRRSRCDRGRGYRQVPALIAQALRVIRSSACEGSAIPLGWL